MSDTKRPSIADIEHILIREDDASIEILPDGTIVQHDPATVPRKPLTMNHNLGGTY